MKMNSLVMLIIMVALLFVGCNRINEPPDNSEQSSTPQMSTSGEQSSTTQISASSEQSSAAQTSNEKPPPIGREANYTAFLEDLYGNKYIDKSDIASEGPQKVIGFYYIDMDGDGAPELIIKQWPNITVYTFDGTVTEVGNERFTTGTERFFHSNNPSYPGIFVFHVGGGLYRYGYTTIKDKQLIYEELWNEDFSGWRENRIEELSDDKGLIRESKRVYDENNDIEWTFIELIEN